MNENIFYIIGAGDCGALNFNKNKGDFVIAADGGYEHLVTYGITPDLTIGDFDSVVIEVQGKVLKLAPEKDDTDMLAAVKYGISKGYENFVIYGGTGGRTDHTLANIQTLKYLAERNCKAEMRGTKENFTVIKNTSIDLFGKGYISVFSLDNKAKGVTLVNLKYPLDNYTMTNGFPIGVSNEFTDKTATISVVDGYLLIIWQNDAN